MTKKKMLALRYHGHPELVMEELPYPEVTTKSVIIRPLAVGIDGTDAHVLAGEFPVDIPIVPGHEVAGTVEEVGKEVKTFKEGDLVCVEPHEYCGLCRYCRTGREHLCVDKKAFGFRINGGLAQAMLAPERVVYKVPSGLSPEIGCLAEPVSCCVHGMDRLDPVSGLSLIVFGAGTAGCILIKLATLAGLSPIVAVEPQADRREMAVKFGADVVFDPSQEGWLDNARAATNQDGYDYIIDAVGSEKILESALKITARGARLLVFGVAHPDAKVRIKPYEIFREELSIIGSAINPFSHYRAVELLPSLDLENLAIRKYALDDYKAAYNGLGGGGKVVISPQWISNQ